jgi:hypothetical protein
MGLVDNRSPELAYSTKNNIVHPGTANRASEDEKLATARAADYVALTQDTVGVAGAVLTLTKHIKR